MTGAVPAAGGRAATRHVRSGVAAAIVVLSIAAYVPFAPARLFDFRAFYCAGRAVLASADPYREHPLHDCERAASIPGMPSGADVTVPAPLPGYALAAFALVARLPFAAAAGIWIAASIAALCAAALLFARCIGIAPLAALIVTGVPAAIVALPLGQVTPFVALGLAVAADGLRRGRPLTAVAGALLTALDPPVALAVCGALFIGVGPTRLGLIAGTLALAGASLGAVGVAANVEYLGAVLHAQAVANVMERTQFSATHFAWIAGVDRGPAVALGEVWYALAVAGGVWAALRLRRRYGSVALVLVPPAFALFGGVYVHFAQLVLAFPAALLVAAHARRPLERSRWCAAVFVLAVPWLTLCAFPVFAPAAALIAFALCGALAQPQIAGRLAAGSAAALLALFAAAAVTFARPPARVHPVVAGNPLAQASWAQSVQASDARPQPLIVLLQLPTVAVLAGCLIALGRAALARETRESD